MTVRGTPLSPSISRIPFSNDHFDQENQFLFAEIFQCAVAMCVLNGKSHSVARKHAFRRIKRDNLIENSP